MCTSRTSKPARLRFRPPGPRAESRRSCVSCASGLVWSTTCDSSPRPKKYSIAADDALGVDQRPRRHVLGVLEAHALLHGAAELEEALAQLVGGQLVDGPQPAVAQVVDVVDVPLAVAQVEDVADRVDVVLGLAASSRSSGIVLVELAVDAEPADLAQAVAVGVEELLVEQLAWPSPAAAGCPGAAAGRSCSSALFVVGGRVFLERLEDQRVAGVLEDRGSCPGCRRRPGPAPGPWRWWRRCRSGPRRSSGR